MATTGGLYIDPSTGVANINMAPFRNKLINGSMRISQRYALASTGNQSASLYTVDRWKLTIAGGGSIAAVQATTVPTTAFTHSLQLTVGTADTSLAASDKYDLRQTIEGNNIYDLAFGTAAAQTFTVSFWVRSSVTGTYAIAFQNGGGTRSYVTTYTIAAANTWQFVSLTIPGDTTGTWATDNTAGLACIWSLSTNGSGVQTATLNAWQGVTAQSPTSPAAVNWIGTAGATFFITGVQLEAGTVASATEVRAHGVELALCQRYYQIILSGLYATQHYLLMGQAYSATAAAIIVALPVIVRAAPTLGYSVVSDFALGNAGATSVTVTGISTSSTSINGLQLGITVASGLVAGNATRLYCNSGIATASLSVSAEL